MISIGNGNKIQNVFLGVAKNCSITQTCSNKPENNPLLEELLTKRNLGKKFNFVGTKYFEHTIVENEGLITYITSKYTVAPKKLVLKAKKYEVVIL